jgi:hypothetical protein
VTRGAETLASATAEVEVLAYNEWPGHSVLPALLAAFVSPNHPALAAVLRDVGARLQRQTGSSALDGYRTRSGARARDRRGRVRRRGNTRHHLREPPPSFERSGQKVRTPEQVLGDRLATCLDLVLLHAAILEHAGLQPLVVLQRGHAFVGVWLREESTPEPWLDLAVELRKRCDLNAIAVVECTLVCGEPAPFAAAQAAARKKLADEAAFVGAIDIAAARRAGIQPLPPRTLAFVAFRTRRRERCSHRARLRRGARKGPRSPCRRLHLRQRPTRTGSNTAGSIIGWASCSTCRCSTGYSTSRRRRRRSASARTTSRSSRTACSRAGSACSRGRRSVKPGRDPRDLELAEQRSGVDVMREYLAEELRAGRLRADLDADELDTRLVEIFRHARTSLEESGANTLYLAVGFLTWYETPQAQKPRRAPLLLLPLVVERLSVQDGFRFVLDDAEPRLNQTLLQMLQRDHDLRVEIGETPPEDDNGRRRERRARRVPARGRVDAAVGSRADGLHRLLLVHEVSDVARPRFARIAAAEPRAATPDRAARRDVRAGGARARARRVRRSRPSTVFCPKDADSSQLAAVLSGAGGRSFVLEGPPGTGKSQTITNLVAQSLANGKRVLFVAEKRAALEVVQRRLDEVGLGAFCLELHSSKSGPRQCSSNCATARARPAPRASGMAAVGRGAAATARCAEPVRAGPAPAS